ncbi:MAG: winged helix-turn-helix domain-containing protein [Acidobacteriota bacterium]
MSSSQQKKRLYEFGPFLLDIPERLLLRDGEPVDLKPKVFDLLALMVENPDHLLEKEWLIERLWPDSFVEESNLNVNVSILRKALGETLTDPQYIETVPKRGYRWVAQVVEKIDEKIDENLSAEFDKAAISRESAPKIASSAAEVEASRGKLPKAVSAGALGIAVVLLLALATGAYFLLGSRAKVATPNSIHTVAVLPFKTSTAEDADNALGLGMADALITRLARLRRINVRPTSAVLKYSNSTDDSITIGGQLKVDAILEGLIQKSDKRIRITAKLFRTEDGEMLWSGTFDDFFTNIFAVQDSISEKMTEALALRLTRDEERLLTRRYTENTEAYQLYLLGKYYERDPVLEASNKALSFYQAAIDKDPDFALAHVGLAGVYLSLGEFQANRREMQEKCREEVNKALTLDPNLGEAYMTLGILKKSASLDWSGAEEAYNRANELSPNNPDIIEARASLLIMRGRADEAIREMDEALRFVPNDTSFLLTYAGVLRFARRYDQAIEQVRKAMEIEPNSINAHIRLAMIYLTMSKADEAMAEVKRAEALGADFSNLYIVGYTNARLGNRAEAERLVRDRLKNTSRQRGVNYFWTALIYHTLGNDDLAFRYLEKAYEERESMIMNIKVEPLCDSLRPDPRFKNLLQRTGLEP